jgi:hypothetical protein
VYRDVSGACARTRTLRRVALLGASGVGKTTLAHSCGADAFVPACAPTVYVDPCRAPRWAIEFWDTTGHLERVGYRQVLTRDAAVLVLCFADARSFRALQHCSLPLAHAEQARARRLGRAEPTLLLVAVHAASSCADDLHGLDDRVHRAFARSIGATAYTSVNAANERSREAFLRLLDEALRRATERAR